MSATPADPDGTQSLKPICGVCQRLDHDLAPDAERLVDLPDRKERVVNGSGHESAISSIARRPCLAATAASRILID